MSGDTARLTSALGRSYRIERELGAGGMATVYLAHDLKHDRDVAIKVLHPDLGAALGGERFLSEIRTTARLQHPHILPLLDSGDADGLLYYVMPVVTGETLRARLERERQLPIADAVRIAREVASALDYAHRQNVIHRDIKPENILLHDGSALVADFGIALAVQSAGGARMTQTGLSLGTPQYMSPEQAMGDKVIDARSDVYALGAMTYEMLIGEPPFTGPSLQAIVARLIAEEPRGIGMQRKAVPPHVESAVLQALEKLPADRFASAAGFAAALQDGTGVSTRATAARVASTSARLRAREMVLGALLLAMTATAAWAFLRERTTADAPVVRTPIGLAAEDRIEMLRRYAATLSPSGDQVAFVAVSAAGTRVMIRRSSELTGRELVRGLASNLAFSPDGRWLAYTRDTVIMKVPVEGGTSVPIGNLSLRVHGILWHTPSTLILGSERGAWSIPAGGGGPRPIARDTSAASGCTWPARSAREDVVLCATGAVDSSRLAGLSIESGAMTPIAIPAIAALGVVDGQLLFVTSAGVLNAIAFDARSLRTSGEPRPILDGILVMPVNNPQVVLSSSGSIAYSAGKNESQLVLAANGMPERMVLAEPRWYVMQRLSPDGSKIAVATGRPGAGVINTYSFAEKTFAPLTTTGDHGNPEWSADGRRVYSGEFRDGKMIVWSHPADRSGPPQRLFETAESVRNFVVSPDEQWLVYSTERDASEKGDIFAVSLSGAKRRLPMATGPGKDQMPRLSPDGQWLAYQTNESGRFEIYVRPFPGDGARVQVSDQGGTEVMWGRSGRTLFYRVENGVTSVAVTTGNAFTLGARRTALTGTYWVAGPHQTYDVAANEQDFLMGRTAGVETGWVVVYNWQRELRERLQAGAR